MTDFHPDFLAAPREHQWTSRLPLLRPVLDQVSLEVQPRYAWWLLTGGAMVAMKREDGIRTVRVARSETPPPGSRGKWITEVGTFARDLLLQGWERRDEETAAGVAVLIECPEVMLCDCGRKKSENAMLFGDMEKCEHCQIAKRSGRPV